MTVYSFEAGSDLSSHQYHAVQLDEDFRVDVITNANAPQIPIGILLNDLEKAEGGLYETDQVPFEIEDPQILQGMLESSNVNSITDMRLRETQCERQFLHRARDFIRVLGVHLAKRLYPECLAKCRTPFVSRIRLKISNVQLHPGHPRHIISR